MKVKLYKSGEIVVDVDEYIPGCIDTFISFRLEPIKTFDDARTYNLICEIKRGYVISNISAAAVKPIEKLYEYNIIMAINSMRDVLTKLIDEFKSNKIEWQVDWKKGDDKDV